jgi:hypothetical protein
MEKSSNRSIAVVTVDDTDPRDPTANCDRCGARGTVARAVRHTDPPLVLRYCSHCWPDAQDELEAGQDEAAWSSASRSWFDVRRFLALIAVPTKGGPLRHLQISRRLPQTSVRRLPRWMDLCHGMSKIFCLATVRPRHNERCS